LGERRKPISAAQKRIRAVLVSLKMSSTNKETKRRVSWEKKHLTEDYEKDIQAKERIGPFCKTTERSGNMRVMVRRERKL